MRIHHDPNQKPWESLHQKLPDTCHDFGASEKADLSWLRLAQLQEKGGVAWGFNMIHGRGKWCPRGILIIILPIASNRIDQSKFMSAMLGKCCKAPVTQSSKDCTSQTFCVFMIKYPYLAESPNQLLLPSLPKSSPFTRFALKLSPFDLVLGGDFLIQWLQGATVDTPGHLVEKRWQH